MTAGIAMGISSGAGPSGYGSTNVGSNTKSALGTSSGKTKKTISQSPRSSHRAGGPSARKTGSSKTPSN